MMVVTGQDPKAQGGHAVIGAPEPGAPGPYEGATASGQALSMHDGVEVWCDCCPCEAEPYWVEVAEELGIDLD